MVADALSYLFSALGITAIGGREEHPQRTNKSRVRAGELLDGWRHLLTHSGLRALYLNNLFVGGLIMATEPLLAVLLLRQLGFPPWQYGLAFAAPCVGGLIGSRLARHVVARYGQHQILRTVGALRAVWLIGLAFVQPGVAGLATVIPVELAIIISMSLYNPVLATYRLEHTPKDASPAPSRPGRSAAAPPSPPSVRSADCSPAPPAHVRLSRSGDCSSSPARCCYPVASVLHLYPTSSWQQPVPNRDGRRFA